MSEASAPNLLDTLGRGFSGAAAARARASYRKLLGIVLAVESVAGLALLVAPLRIARLLRPGGGDTAFTRLAGLLLLFVVLLLLAGRAHPVRAKLVNITGVVGRVALGVALIAIGQRLIAPGMIELAAAAGLGWLYYRYFTAEVMDRP